MADNYDAYWADIGVDPVSIEMGQDVVSATLKPVPELPLVSNSSFDIVAVVGNKDSVRISWDNLVQNFVKSTTDIPTGPGQTSTYDYATIAVDSSAVYTVDNNSAWGKTPRYTANWSDLTGDTRFLLVNKAMTGSDGLSETERNNVWESIHLYKATNSAIGVVKGSDSVIIEDDGSITVPMASAKTSETPGTVGTVRIIDADNPVEGEPVYAVSTRYLDVALNNFASTYTPPVASYTLKGVVQIAPESSSALRVDSGVLSLPFANSTTYGAVRTAADAEDETGVARVSLVNSIVDSTKDSILNAKASATTLGMVQLPSDGTIITDYDPVAGTGTGTISLQVATLNNPGIVTAMTASIAPNSSDVTKAVTQKAVVDYVDAELDDFVQKNLPVASTTTLGAIKVGNGLKIAENTVGQLDVVNASQDSIGGVKVQSGTSDPNPITVPTVKKVQEMLGSAGVGTATFESTGVVKLGTNSVINDGVPVGLNSNSRMQIDKAQIRNVVDSLIPGAGLATTSKTGVVKLSSDNYEDGGYKIGICSANDGAIFVATNDVPMATTGQPGFVTLSTNVTLSASHAAIGVDSYGQLRATAISGGGSGGSSYTVSGDTDIAEDDSAKVGLLKDTNVLAVDRATSGSYGTVLLGTNSIIESGSPVGVDSNGRLWVETTGGGGGGGSVSYATYTTGGIVKLGTSSYITGDSVPVGFDADQRLVISADQITTTPATASKYGTVILGSEEVIEDAYAPVALAHPSGLEEDQNSLAVKEATGSDYGVVKVTGESITGNRQYTKIGKLADGSLAVPVDDEVAPFRVTVNQVGGGYTVSMQGGAVQLNDGTIVNVESVEDLDIGSPKEGQSLVLTVTKEVAEVEEETEDGEIITVEREVAKAKFKLVDTIKVVNCTPEAILS